MQKKSNARTKGSRRCFGSRRLLISGITALLTLGFVGFAPPGASANTGDELVTTAVVDPVTGELVEAVAEASAVAEAPDILVGPVQQAGPTPVSENNATLTTNHGVRYMVLPTHKVWHIACHNPKISQINQTIPC